MDVNLVNDGLRSI